MSRDELNEMEQLHALERELAAAGRVARSTTACHERPDPAFAMNLRAKLLRELPAPATLEVPMERVERTTGPLEADTAAAPEPIETLTAAAWPADERRHIGRRFSGFGPGRPYAVGPAEGPEAEETSHRPVALRPSVASRVPTIPRVRLWTGLAAAAAVGARLFMGNGYFWPERSQATTADVANAELVRNGAVQALVAGTELHEGDEVRVGDGGYATLSIGLNVVRLQAGADLRLERLAVSSVVVDQLAGRVYHRVVPPAGGGDYQVQTASVTWLARGTAFDLDRHAQSGGEVVQELSLQHAVEARGPGIDLPIEEGSSVLMELASDGQPTNRAIAVRPIDGATLHDAWLVDNAKRDADLGLPLGMLAELVTSPTPTPTPTPTEAETPPVTPTEPVETTTPTSGPTPSATPSPTPKPTPRWTPPPTPTPTKPPSVGTLKVSNEGSGKYSFCWSKYTGSGFSYYKLVKAAYPTIPSYGKAGDLLEAISDINQVVSGTHELAAGDYYVRVQAVGESGGTMRILASSNVVRVTVKATATPTPAASLPPTVNLGAPVCQNNADGSVTLKWTAYTGLEGWNYYKIPYLPWSASANPSYPASNFTNYFVADKTATEFTTDPGAFASGEWAIRIQAIGYPNGAYAYGQTTVCHLTVP